MTGAGSTYTAAGSLRIGANNQGQASLVISDGGSVSAQDTEVGFFSQAPNLVTVSGAGSLLTTNGKLTIGGYLSRGSSLAISAGASASATTTVIGENNYYGGANSLTITGAGSKFTNTGSLTLAVNAADNGTLNLVNTAGTTVLSGTLAHTGATWINGGTLLVNGSLASSAVTVDSGGTLGGSGTIGGLATFASGAHLAPGNSPGTITFTGGLTLSSGTILDFQLGTTSDLILVTGGTLTGPLSGTITLNLSDSGGFTAGTYTLIDATGASLSSIGGTSFDLGTTIAGYTYTFAQHGNLFQLIATASAIPEPATYATLAGVLTLALAGWRRRRRRAHA